MTNLIKVCSDNCTLEIMTKEQYRNLTLEMSTADYNSHTKEVITGAKLVDGILIKVDTISVVMSDSEKVSIWAQYINTQTGEREYTNQALRFKDQTILGYPQHFCLPEDLEDDNESIYAIDPNWTITPAIETEIRRQVKKALIKQFKDLQWDRCLTKAQGIKILKYFK